MTDLAPPPRAWFELDEPSEPTALTITPDGQVYGHVAAWGSCHTGHMGTCLEPPENPSGEYPWFNLGTRQTDDGEVTVGQITMDADHARLTLGIKDAHDHYANSALAIADVHAYEGEQGIWVCGAVRPGVTPEQMECARSLKLSGDWRPTSDGMEMIAALAVPFPGFVVPRASLVASGGEPEVTALVAAGVVQDPPTPPSGGNPVSASVSNTQLRVMAAQARGGLKAAAELAHR